MTNQQAELTNKALLQKIKDTIVQSVSPEKIFLFGSYAAGNQTIHSDIDILIIVKSLINQHQRNLQIKRLFPHRNFALDVFVFTPEEEKKYKDITGTLLNTAIKQGRLLYERK